MITYRFGIECSKPARVGVDFHGLPLGIPARPLDDEEAGVSDRAPAADAIGVVSKEAVRIPSLPREVSPTSVFRGFSPISASSAVPSPSGSGDKRDDQQDDPKRALDIESRLDFGVVGRGCGSEQPDG